MKLTRTELREKIMIILYQIDFYKKENLDFDIKKVIKENVEIENEFVNSIVYGVFEKVNEIDNLIGKYIKNWDLNRLGKTDKAILRLSTYELMYYDTPKIVCINEAIELAKKYSDDKIVKLINGVLDNILDNEVKGE
jgi:N utilization substance protein B